MVGSIDGPVVLVAHSYGGAVISNVDPDAGDIVALVYVNGFAPDAGEDCFTLSTMFPGSVLGDALQAVQRHDGLTDLSIRQERFHEVFAPDVDAEQAALMAATQRPATQEALTEPSGERPLWKGLPSWFVYGEEDRVIPAALHHFMAERARAHGTMALRGASHAVASSRPDATVQTILEASALADGHGLTRGRLRRREPTCPPSPPTPRSCWSTAAQELVLATGSPPFLYELTPDEARAVLDEVQAQPIAKLPVGRHLDQRCRPALGDVGVRIVRPPDAVGPLPAILYMHGGGWVLGNSATHDRLVRELAVGSNAALVFVDYHRSPEARYPVAIEQGYAVAQWIVREGAAHGLDADRLAVAGDSVGGCMTAALTLMATRARRRPLRAPVACTTR